MLDVSSPPQLDSVSTPPTLDSVDIRLQVERAASLVAEARRLNDEKQHARAVLECTKAISLAPTSWAAHLERSRAHLEIFRRDSSATVSRDQAVKDGKRAAFMNTASWRCALQRSRAVGAAGRLEEAFEDLRLVEQLAVKDAEGDSVSDITFAIEDQRGRLQLETAKALKFSGVGADRWMPKLAQTIRTLDKALAANKPRSADTLNNRGVAYYESSMYAPAMADFQSALSLDPHHDRALSNRALVLRNLNKLEAAHASLSAAIAENPTSAISFNNMGCIERDLGRNLTALTHFYHAVDLDPANEQAIENRDSLLCELRQPVPIHQVADVAISCVQTEPMR